MKEFSEFYNRRKNGSIKWCSVQVEKDEYKHIPPMTMADMDFQMSDNIKEAIQAYTETEILGYTKPTENYLNAVQDFFIKHHQFHIEHDWVVTTPGIVNALSTSVRAFTKMNERIILFTPVYNPFYEVVESQDRKIEKCALHLKDNRYYIDFEKLEFIASQPDVKMLLLCSPHNPGGRIWSAEELQTIIDIVIKHDLIVVSDEIHADLKLNGKQHHLLPTIDNRILNQSIICTAASKTFNIAGLQCSNIFIANQHLREKFIQANLSVGINGANVLGMIATQAAYEKCDRWLEKVKQLIEQHHHIVESFFSDLDDRFQVMRQDASFLAWINYSELGIEPHTFIRFLEKECQLFVNDGRMYGDEAKYFIRMNVGLPSQALLDNLNRFATQFKRKFQNSKKDAYS